ncbi:MAG: 50S ribosomal protein L24 [Candidatus Riflebacteria bacterium]|nr:50S ribosomal protein L24 [Candidatus Riflebacteria bacterium]
MLKTVKARRAVEKPHIKKDDTVIVIAGDDTKKKGRVLQVLRLKGMVVVEGVNYVKRHQKPSKKIGRGGIVQKEGPIAISRVALFCGKCNSNTRAKFVSHETEVSRVCKECNEPIGRK